MTGGQMDSIQVQIVGIRPLLMHNGQLANPLNKWAQDLKKVSSKPGRNKTDDDYQEIMRIEFLGGLYYDEKIGVYMPGVNIESCIQAGARLKKNGVKIQRGVQCIEERCAFTYDGPRTNTALWDLVEYRDVRAVKLNGKATMMRCRPIFREWTVDFTLHYIPSVINPEEIRQAVDDAGAYVGLGDYTPRHGRFKVQLWKVANGK